MTDLQEVEAERERYREALEGILHTDKTPSYDYGEGDDAADNRDLTPADVGKTGRWMTPREIAREALQLEGTRDVH
jgi:hypothetical protein